MDIKKMTIEKAQNAFKAGEFSSLELTRAYIEEIKKKNVDINAYLEIFSDAEDMAKKADEIIARGEMKALTGIPVALKDNILFKDHIASASSKILENYKAVYSSTVVKDLLDQGAVIIGRTNMDEFAMGSSTETSAYGITKNPKDLSGVAGGSSGGSAAAVSGDMVLFALGSDTGGSIRQPAGFCGVVGLKPTYGTITRHGLMAMGSSLDIIGPITNSVSDAEIVFNTLAHSDSMDSTSFADDVRICEKKEVKTIGVPRSFLNGEGISKEVLENFEKSLEKLKKLGYEIKDVEIPFIEYSLAVYYVLMPAEVSTNLSRYDGIRYGLSLPGKNIAEAYKNTKTEGFGEETKRRLLLGTYVLSHGYYDAYYNKAIKLRAKITQEIKKILKEVDLIATPTTPTEAFRPGEKKNPVSMYLSDIFTVPANIAGVPSIAIPNGEMVNEMPDSIQFTAPHFGEDLLFQVGKKFEQA
ncbi:MAG: Asp-tRNA(Asn)/Glu-tRNA(Gln) amidotransferase subunit GatA [Bacteroidetes bacterium]|nr:Asp-tRNA(Asn)/Glu-tRNA(Gln) amidotransferase subunit GatA [Bacteroidota bacterium]